MKKKIFIICAIIVIAIISSIIFDRVRNKSSIEENETVVENKTYFVEFGEGKRQNISEKISEPRKFEDLDITNVSILYSNEICKMQLNVENNTNLKTNDMMIKVNILDENKNVIVNLNGFIAEINPGQSLEVNMESSKDFSNAYDYEIMKK